MMTGNLLSVILSLEVSCKIASLRAGVSYFL